MHVYDRIADQTCVLVFTRRGRYGMRKTHGDVIEIAYSGSLMPSIHTITGILLMLLIIFSF